jgi:hypothetical protein
MIAHSLSFSSLFDLTNNSIGFVRKFDFGFLSSSTTTPAQQIATATREGAHEFHLLLMIVHSFEHAETLELFLKLKCD